MAARGARSVVRFVHELHRLKHSRSFGCFRVTHDAVDNFAAANSDIVIVATNDDQNTLNHHRVCSV